MAIAISAARFVRGRGTTVVSHESWRLSPRNGPVTRRKSEKKRAPVLRVEIMITAPRRLRLMDAIMCQQCSNILPDDHDTTSVKIYAKTYGGAWIRYVTTLE